MIQDYAKLRWWRRTAGTNNTDLKNNDMNLDMETKMGGGTKDFAPPKASNIENYRMPWYHEKETFEKMFDEVKSNGGRPRSREPAARSSAPPSSPGRSPLEPPRTRCTPSKTAPTPRPGRASS